MTSKQWCFTLNNSTNNHEACKIKETLFTDCSYIVTQYERGESGNCHWQGYIEFSETKSLSDLRRMLPGGHFEIRRGSQQQAIDYCKKEESRIGLQYEWGTPSYQGKRVDLEEIRKRIICGWTNLDIANDYFGSWCRYHRSFITYRNLIQPVRTWKPEVFMCYGPPGSGKSKYALESSGAETQYWKQRSQWWDLYEGHETVVLDDYYGWLPWDVLLRILDRYPLLVETKGGQVQFLAKKIFITSNSKPSEWYKESPNFKALTRRIEHWIYFKKEGEVYELPNWEMFDKATVQ